MREDTISTGEVELRSEVEIDPVCGATVDLELAREADLIAEFAEREYAFCGTACRDQFLGEPIAYAVAGRDAP